MDTLKIDKNMKFTIKQEKTIVDNIEFNVGDHISATIPDLWTQWFDGYIESIDNTGQSFKIRLYANEESSFSYTWFTDGTTDTALHHKFQIKLRRSVI